MDDLLSTRTKLRTKATKLCNDLRSCREGDRKLLDPDQLALKLHHLKKLQNELQGVQDQLDKLGQPDDSSHSQNMEDEMFLGSRLLARLEKAEDTAQKRADLQGSMGNADLKASVAVKIPIYHGDVMRWSEFWELFAISVHDNPGYADVQKFVVLKSHLAGAALRTIQGIPVSGDGYTQAVAVLKERFDQDEVRREVLMRELLNMPSVRHGDLKGMRSLIDHLSAHTRALNTLGVPAESFSSLLLPVVKGKIPEDWRLEWARQENNDFSVFVQFLNREVRLRESAKGVSTPAATSEVPPSAPSVTSSMTARREPRKERAQSSQKSRKMACSACGLGHQQLDQCAKFHGMAVQDRWSLAKALKACFRCLGYGHRSRDCKKIACAECGRHHHILLHYLNPSAKSPSEIPVPELSPEAVSFSPAQLSHRETGLKTVDVDVQ